MAENDLEKKLKELESKIEEKNKEITTLWCWLCIVTIIVLIISFSMILGFINSLMNYFQSIIHVISTK